MKGILYRIDNAELPKAVAEAIEAFKKSTGASPTIIMIRHEDYVGHGNNLPLQVMLVNKTIQPGHFILYPEAQIKRHPVKKPLRRTPCE